jgi:hypothetical protein
MITECGFGNKLQVYVNLSPRILQSDKHIQLYTLRQRLTKRNRKIMAANGIEISGLQNDNELHDINDDYKSDVS